MSRAPLLSVRGLSTHFLLAEGVLRAVDGVSFDIAPGETVALVGESGCGKTIVALSLLRLVSLPGRIVGGSVLFNGADVLRMPTAELRRVRGTGMGMVFQEPGASLNPVLTIGSQLTEVLRTHRGMNRAEADAAAVRMLGDVGIPEPERCERAYPFQLSGGMKQRAVLALAACTRPRLLIADEPTTALDVTVQAEILELLRELQSRHGMAILVISHDLAVVAQLAHRVLVMYTGRIVEAAPMRMIFHEPRHPYTRGLLASVNMACGRRKEPLAGIPGAVPDLLALPGGCTFRPRCASAVERCAWEVPPLDRAIDEHHCACWRTGVMMPAQGVSP
jgi:peptide/nickel transport system ATP-binding protein